MAWQDTAIFTLRVLINDIGATPTYADDTLISLLLVAAVYVKQDIDFDTTYTMDVIAQTITPDPASDAAFMNFMIMKAACQADLYLFRTKALMDGITAKMGPAALTVAGNLKGFKDILAIGPCATYQSMRTDYIYGGGQLCKAVLSPFVGNNFDPDSLGVNQAFYGDATRSMNSNSEEYY